MKVGILNPGEMGAAVGKTLVAAGHEVAWASSGRSAATARRAGEAGLRDLGSVAALAGGSEAIFSICPPYAARQVAEEVERAGFEGIFIDANAIAPVSARAVAAIVGAGGASYVDGGIVGGPPTDSAGPRLFLSGAEATSIAVLFADTVVTALVLDSGPFAASALKVAYAAWTKGSAALLLTAMGAARRAGVDDALAAEWERSQPQLAAMLARAEASADAKGWRWVGEMEEIATALADLGLPDGFHRAAARVFEQADRES